MQNIFRFGPLEIVPAQRLLVVGGIPVKLGGRAFDLLLAFAERPGQLIGKQELLESAWGRADLSDSNLHVHISMLRKQLGSAAIATVPGRGYCFTLASGAAPEPIAAGGSQPGSDAAQPQALLGRRNDIESIERLLAEHRLVTITGAGGIGKTSVARWVIWHRRDLQRDGTAQVDLTAIEAAHDIPAAMATALRVAIDGSDPLATLARALRPLDALVLLDNAEEVIEGLGAVLATLLEAAPSMRFLVTSQVPLKLAGVHRYRLDALSFPSAVLGVEESLGFAAVALLMERVQTIDRHFRLHDGNLVAAIEICRKLDGVPLAIELVAAPCASLGLTVVQAQLDQRFSRSPAPNPIAPERQQTLSAVMDWSHARLSAPQQAAFRRLGVFAGGFTIELAQAVLSDLERDGSDGIDLLADLVEHSLVAMEPSTAPRYRLLETARAYALSRLHATDEIGPARQRHARALCELFEQADQACWSLPEAQFVARYEPELDNLRAALEWSLQHDAGAAIALAGASGRLWRWLSLHHEALHWLGRAAALVEDHSAPALAARLWEALALQYGESASVEGREPARRAAALYRQLGDRRGQYLALAHLAYSYRYTESDEARLALVELRRLEDPGWPPSVRLFGARLETPGADAQERIREGRAVNALRLALATAAGSEYEANSALVNLADLALTAGDADEAVRRNRDLLARLSRRHMASRIIALGNLIEALVARESLAEAREVACEFVDAAGTLDFMFGMFAIDALALLAALEQRWTTAAHLLGYSDLAYAARHRERGPNEQAIRDRLWALLQQHVEGGNLQTWIAHGAVLSATSTCALALHSPV